MKKADKAINYFRNKYNCSQAVFTVFGTDYGLPENECLKVACAFGGGMGRQQYTCGAIMGALMALGLECGKGLNDSEEKKQLTYSKTRELFAEFNKLHGTTNCRELLNGLDFNNCEDLKKILEQRLFDIKCEKFVADSVIIVEKIME